MLRQRKEVSHLNGSPTGSPAAFDEPEDASKSSMSVERRSIQYVNHGDEDDPFTTAQKIGIAASFIISGLTCYLYMLYRLRQVEASNTCSAS